VAAFRAPFYFINLWLIPDRHRYWTYLYYSRALTFSHFVFWWATDASYAKGHFDYYFVLGGRKCLFVLGGRTTGHLMTFVFGI